MQFKDMMLSKYTIEKKGETPIRLSIDGAPRSCHGSGTDGGRAGSLPRKVVSGSDGDPSIIPIRYY